MFKFALVSALVLVSGLAQAQAQTQDPFRVGPQTLAHFNPRPECGFRAMTLLRKEHAAQVQGWSRNVSVAGSAFDQVEGHVDDLFPVTGQSQSQDHAFEARQAWRESFKAC